MAVNYARLFHRRATPQSQPIPGSTQVPNSAGQFWNANRASEPGLGANECVPSGKWCKSTAFRQFFTA